LMQQRVRVLRDEHLHPETWHHSVWQWTVYGRLCCSDTKHKYKRYFVSVLTVITLH
jgi:hypothetical protein